MYLPRILIVLCSLSLLKMNTGSAVPDCSVLDECAGERNALRCLWWWFSCIHACSVSTENPALHKDKIISTHVHTLLSALHSFWEYSLFILSWISNLYPQVFEILFLYQRIPSFNKPVCAMWWRDVIALVPDRLEPRLHQKTETCFVQSPRKKGPFPVSASS